MAERKQIADLFCYRTTGRTDEEKLHHRIRTIQTLVDFCKVQEVPRRRSPPSRDWGLVAQCGPGKVEAPKPPPKPQSLLNTQCTFNLEIRICRWRLGFLASVGRARRGSTLKMFTFAISILTTHYNAYFANNPASRAGSSPRRWRFRHPTAAVAGWPSPSAKASMSSSSATRLLTAAGARPALSSRRQSAGQKGRRHGYRRWSLGDVPGHRWQAGRGRAPQGSTDTE